MRLYVIMWTFNQCDWPAYKAQLLSFTIIEAESYIIKQ